MSSATHEPTAHPAPRVSASHTTTARSSSPPNFIRLARPDEAGIIASLGAEIFRRTFGHSCTPEQLQKYLDENYTEKFIAQDISDPQKDLIVATSEDDKILGFGLLTRGSTEPCVQHLSKTVELQRLYVDIAAHGRGLGKKLILEMEDMARKQGFEHMWLGVWEFNDKARGLYEKQGYRYTGAHDFDVGGDIQTDHILFKKL